MIEPIQLDLGEAQRVHSDLRSGDAVNWESIETRLAKEHFPVRKIDIDGLMKELRQLQKRYPEKLPSRSSEGTSFDSEAAVLIHRKLPLDDFVAANQGFWAWCSLKFFWDLINWRHSGKSEVAIPENFSITKRRHGLLERLWFRAELGKIEGKDPYKYVLTATDRDFWESGIIRPSYCSCRAVARAFIRYQFQTPSGYLHLTEPSGVRQLYKRISRIYATVALDVLEESEAYDLISEMGQGLFRSRRKEENVIKRRAIA